MSDGIREAEAECAAAYHQGLRQERRGLEARLAACEAACAHVHRALEAACRQLALAVPDVPGLRDGVAAQWVAALLRDTEEAST